MRAPLDVLLFTCLLATGARAQLPLGASAPAYSRSLLGGAR